MLSENLSRIIVNIYSYKSPTLFLWHCIADIFLCHPQRKITSCHFSVYDIILTKQKKKDWSKIVSDDCKLKAQNDLSSNWVTKRQHFLIVIVQVILDKVIKESKMKGLTINWKKTQCMVISKRNSPSYKLETWKSIKYRNLT